MSDEYNNRSTLGDKAPTLQRKNKVIAAILCFVLGQIGIHRFYLGRVGSGILMCALTLIGWITSVIYIGSFFIAAVAIWNIVDFIRILCNSLLDAHGNKLI